MYDMMSDMINIMEQATEIEEQTEAEREEEDYA
jgi:hypothetical protein